MPRGLKKSKKLLRVYSKNLFKKILFTDEKIFTIEHKFNKQNDEVYVGTNIIGGQIKSSHNSNRLLPIFCDGVVGSVLEWG